MHAKKHKIYPAYVSRQNSIREKQVIILMILNGEECHYLAARKLSKHHGDFYYLNCPHSSVTKNKLESREKVCEHKNISKTVMSSEDTKILELNQ